MSIEFQLLTSLELLLSTFLSMLVGLERDRRNQPAGLRTHMLVGFGSCLFTILSFHAFPGSDPARVAAQVVTGIGFLGAGTILHLHRTHGASDIKHLTTAASIWATAGIGMAVGTGAWLLAINGTLITWIILAVVRRLEPDK
ncbi:MAG: magnesium transporter MgtC [Anaerolineaceae bacterium]|nr:magnesium transporter MgtC [Anaerolineaceae bacterium]